MFKVIRIGHSQATVLLASKFNFPSVIIHIFYISVGTQWLYDLKITNCFNFSVYIYSNLSIFLNEKMFYCIIGKKDFPDNNIHDNQVKNLIL